MTQQDKQQGLWGDGWFCLPKWSSWSGETECVVEDTDVHAGTCSMASKSEMLCKPLCTSVVREMEDVSYLMEKPLTPESEDKFRPEWWWFEKQVLLFPRIA